MCRRISITVRYQCCFRRSVSSSLLPWSSCLSLLYVLVSPSSFFALLLVFPGSQLFCCSNCFPNTMLAALLMCPQSPALASEARNDLDCHRCSPTLLPETTELLFMFLASVGHKNMSHVPHYLLALSCSLTRMKSFSVEKHLSLLISCFWMAGGAAAQGFFYLSQNCQWLYVASCYPVTKIVYELIFCSPSGILHMRI